MESKNDMDLAFLVRKYRTDHNLTIEELAFRAEIADGTLRNIESGDRGTTLRTLVKIAKAIGISPTSLLDKKYFGNTDFLTDKLHLNINNLSERDIHLLRVTMEALYDTMTTVIPKDLLVGQRIYKCRLEKDITARRLAQMIGITSAVLRNMETGKTPVSIAVLKSISAALDVSLDYLLSDVSKEAELSVLNEIMEKSHETFSEEDFALMRNTYFYMIDGFPEKPKGD